MSELTVWWNEVTPHLRTDAGQGEDSPLPDPDDVIDSVGSGWMADARAEAVRRLDLLAGRAMRQHADEWYRWQEEHPHPDAPGPIPPPRPGPSFSLGLLATRLENREAVTVKHFEDCHRVWLYAKDRNGLLHPLAALIEGWMTDKPAQADTRPTAIVPATLARVRDVVDAPASLFDLSGYDLGTKTVGFTPVPELQGYLPGLELPTANRMTAPVLQLWDVSTEGEPRKGKGAPLAMRTWLEAVLAVSVDDRAHAKGVEIAWRDFTNWLMPNGEYRRNHFPAIWRALHSVHNLRIPWERSDGVGGLRTVVSVVDAPRRWNAYDDLVHFRIDLPPGVNSRGPLVYRPALRALGQQSSLRYRAYLGLCWLWDRHGATGGRYIQPTRPLIARDAADRILDAQEQVITGRDGQPVRTWTVPGRDGRRLRDGIVPLDSAGNPAALPGAAQERNPAADRYPVLSPAEVVDLCYPPARAKLSPSAARKRRERARAAIELMADAGYCIVEDLQGGIRILPPKGWGAGFTG